MPTTIDSMSNEPRSFCAFDPRKELRQLGGWHATTLVRVSSFSDMGAFRIDSVEEREDAIAVRFDDISFQTEGRDGGAVHVTPYAFIVLPRSKKPVVLEENVQNLLGQTSSISFFQIFFPSLVRIAGVTGKFSASLSRDFNFPGPCD